MESTYEAWKSIGTTLGSFSRPLLLSHTKPDGDAFGSLVAMRALLRGAGSDPLAVAFDPVPRTYQVFNRFEPIAVWERDVGKDDLKNVDGLVVLDTCSYGQLDPLAEWIRRTDLPKVAVDHHVTRDDLADHLVVDESAAATCLILLDFARVMSWPITDDIATALFIGIATDTGWFGHSNTDARTLHAAADLADHGFDAHQLYQRLFLCDSVERVRLRAAVLNSLTLHADDRLAVMTLDQATLHRIGARLSETENLINEPLRAEPVAVSVLLMEQAQGPIRVSFRSKAPVPGVCDQDIDVAALAAVYGGGGHRRAAGARIEGTLETVRQRVTDQIEQALT